MNNKLPHLDDEITRKNLDLCENHLFRLKYREKMKRGDFKSKIDPKPPLNEKSK